MLKTKEGEVRDIEELKRFVNEIEEFRRSSGLQEVIEEANRAMELVREIYYGKNGLFRKEKENRGSLFYGEGTTVSYPSL